MALRWEVRTVAVAAGLAVALVMGATCAVLLLGDYPIAPADAVRAVLGQGADPLAVYFVQEQRLPRVVCAILVGAALAASGSIIQTLTGNPLGSPDVIGFTTGSATGALVMIVLVGSGPGMVGVAAVVGGLAVAALVVRLTRRGGMSGFRLVLVGLGVGLILEALNTLLVVRASLASAQDAAQWLAGSLNATGWSDVAVIGVALALLLPPAVVLARPLEVLRAGDELAGGLGVGVLRVRRAALVVGVALVAVATAVCGPIAFVALAAPQLARRLTWTGGLGLGTSCLVGAALVLASDAVAQRLFAPTQLAVGVVTGCLGGVYLIWLLVIEGRRA
ncbi:UNVERIFIED_CONTAM: hypothetical protein LK11_27865 [Mumia flava]